MYSRPLKITEHQYLFGLFLNGLKDEVRVELELHSFHTLEELMDMAEMVESRNKMLQKGGARGFGRSFPPSRVHTRAAESSVVPLDARDGRE